MANEPKKEKHVAVNNDAALRAAQEKAAKAERELAEARKKLADLEPAKAPPRASLPREKASGRFVVGPKGHYREGTKYEMGDVIVIKDEIPGSDWTPVDEAEKSSKGKAKKAVEAEEPSSDEPRDANTQI